MQFERGMRERGSRQDRRPNFAMTQILQLDIDCLPQQPTPRVTATASGSATTLRPSRSVANLWTAAGIVAAVALGLGAVDLLTTATSWAADQLGDFVGNLQTWMQSAPYRM